MTYEERKIAKKRRKQLDEKYLERQLLKLTNRREVILELLDQFKTSHRLSYKGERTHILRSDLIPILGVNNRTIDLLCTDQYIKDAFFSTNQVFAISDIVSFIESIP